MRLIRIELKDISDAGICEFEAALPEYSLQKMAMSIEFIADPAVIKYKIACIKHRILS